RLGGRLVERHLLVLRRPPLALDAEEPPEQRLVEVLVVGADELDLGEAAVDHQRHEGAVAPGEEVGPLDGLEQAGHLVLGEDAARVGGGAAVPLHGAGGVLVELARAHEVLAEPPQRREVGRDGDLAERALLHEVALVPLDVGLAEAEATALAGEVAGELVERAAVGADGVGALPGEVLREEAVHALLALGAGEGVFFCTNGHRDPISAAAAARTSRAPPVVHRRAGAPRVPSRRGPVRGGIPGPMPRLLRVPESIPLLCQFLMAGGATAYVAIQYATLVGELVVNLGLVIAF